MQDVPDMGKGYITVPDTLYFDSDEGVPYFAIKDKSGNPVADVFAGESIEVYSQEFKTEAGIHPGMQLHAAAKIAGEENIHIWLGWPNDYFTIENTVSGLAWKVYGGQLIGGNDKFQEISMHGTVVTLADFSPDATIASIAVFYGGAE